MDLPSAELVYPVTQCGALNKAPPKAPTASAPAPATLNLHAERDFADKIKVKDPRWGDYPWCSRQDQPA